MKIYEELKFLIFSMSKKLVVFHQTIASMLYLKLIFIQDNVSYYEVEIKIVTSPNELLDSKIFKFP